MDINKYIDEVVSFLFQNGIYDINDIDERKRIEDKIKVEYVFQRIDDLIVPIENINRIKNTIININT